MLVLQNPLNYYDCFGFQYSHCATRSRLRHTHTNCMNNSLLNCCNGEECGKGKGKKRRAVCTRGGRDASSSRASRAYKINRLTNIETR